MSTIAEGVPPMTRFAIFAAAALILAACQTERPYRGEYPRPAPPAGGAPTRAPGGTAAPHVRVAPASGPVAVLAGGQVGPYMDNQEAELRQRLRGTGVRVARVGDVIALVMRNDVLFASDGTALSHPALRTIDAVGEVLRHYDKTLIEVNGYTDTTGRDDYNLKLSQRRAEAVADVMVDDGVNPARISPRGFGETQLRVPTGDNVNEPRNRRVEIRIVPHTAQS